MGGNIMARKGSRASRSTASSGSGKSANQKAKATGAKGKASVKSELEQKAREVSGGAKIEPLNDTKEGKEILKKEQEAAAQNARDIAERARQEAERKRAEELAEEIRKKKELEDIEKRKAEEQAAAENANI